MSVIWSMGFAALLGIALSQQSVINAAVGQILGAPVAAAALSLTLSALIVIAVAFLMTSDVKTSQFFALPWWWIIAGFVGAAYIAGGAILIPTTGAALFFVCLVAGQLTGAVIADAIGAFGLEPKALSLPKVAGVGLAFLGVMLVRFG